MSWRELSLCDIRGILGDLSARVASVHSKYQDTAYLVGLVRSSGCGLALLTRCELSEVAMIVSLPVGILSTYEYCRRIVPLSEISTYILW